MAISGHPGCTVPFPAAAVYLVIAAGVIDFLSAFFFGFSLRVFFPSGRSCLEAGLSL